MFKILRKSICVFLFLFLNHFVLFAQKDSVAKYYINASVNYGFIMAHHPYMAHLQTGNTKSIDLTFCKHSNPDSRWGNDYQYPDYGFGLSYYDLANPQLLGNAYSVYACTYLPITRNKNFKWNVELAYGLGYIEKSFNRVENYKNTAIGSNLNCFIQISNTIAYRFNQVNKLQLGISFSHFSNGSFRKPNLGINIPALQFSYGRYFGTESIKQEAKQKAYLPNHFQHYVYAAAGVKRIRKTISELYETYTLGYENVKYISNKCGLGVGAEIIYDNSLEQMIEIIEGRTGGSNIQVGAFGRFILRMGKIEADVDAGYSLISDYNDENFIANGRIYTKLGLKRFFNDKYYLAINLKTHFAVADHFELAFGVKI